MSMVEHKAGRLWLAHPVLSLILAGSWLLLQRSVAPADLLAACVLALVVPRVTAGFIGNGAKLQSVGAVIRLLRIVLWDIVVSNLTVAKIVLNPMRSPTPAWVPVTLDITHENGIALLASIITMTPGTVSCVVDQERRRIMVHALDCDDPAAMARDIKARYEQPLKEIFG
jgi:multicomponent K+:H+ antiporter subunit E